VKEYKEDLIYKLSNNLIPVLITIKDNVVQEAMICKSAKQLEQKFKKECLDYGVCPNENNYDDGYMLLEDGTSICMTWSSTYE